MSARRVFLVLLAIEAAAVKTGHRISPDDWLDISSTLESSKPVEVQAADAASASSDMATASGNAVANGASGSNVTSATKTSKADQAKADLENAVRNLESLKGTISSLEQTVKVLRTKRKKEEEAALKKRPKPEFDRSDDRYLCEYSNCQQCTLQKGCGWCASLHKCLEGDRRGPFNAKCKYWDHEACEGGCSVFPDCGSCLKEEGCGFCTKTCECVQGNAAGPGFNNTCGGGWFHSKAEKAKTCVPAEKWPGASDADMDTKVCAAKQFQLLRIRHLALEVDRKNAIGFAKAMEEDDKIVW